MGWLNAVPDGLVAASDFQNNSESPDSSQVQMPSNKIHAPQAPNEEKDPGTSKAVLDTCSDPETEHLECFEAQDRFQRGLDAKKAA